MTPALPLYGHDGAQLAFLEAAASGRLAHAWLVEGPSGIGKARFALRLAAWLLGARGPRQAPLDAPASDPVMRRILAGSHPDLSIQARRLNDKGKLAQDVSVEQVRELSAFFSLKPALGGWRIGIIDAIDEANRNAENALLKTLEEPPARSLLILVNHRSRPLLPTIRSRCRPLRLELLSQDDTARALETAGAGPESADAAPGRPGLCISLSAPPARRALSAAQALLRAMPSPPDKLLTAAVQAASEGPEAALAIRRTLLDWVAEKAVTDPAAADIWLRMARLTGEAETLNTENVQLTARLIACAAEAAGAAPQKAR